MRNGSSGGQEEHVFRVLITDLDNTLWDWFAAWHASFDAMLNKLVELSGVDRVVLEAEIHKIHQQRGTSEYSNLLSEMPSLQRVSGSEQPIVYFDEAMHQLNSKRKANTKLYPGVLQTLSEIKKRGIKIVAYTESISYWAEWRIKHTSLDGVIDVLYSAPDHDLPEGISVSDLRRTDYRDAHDYGLKLTEHRHVPRHELKPNPAVLKAILADLDCEPVHALYVGDSLMKDVAMAQQAGVADAHAKYGEVQHAIEYDQLRRVSHWPDVTVAREAHFVAAPEVIPSIVLRRSFREILPHFGVNGFHECEAQAT